MSQDKEAEIKHQFLEEAEEHIAKIESALLELASTKSDRLFDAILRAAHSLKGGAAMMGFQTLSSLAHRLEDFFKILKIKPSLIDPEVEKLLLTGVDCLSQVVKLNFRGDLKDEQWLESANPAFEQLHQILGESQTIADTIAIVSEDGQDMAGLIFETEVEEYLQRLESLLIADLPAMELQAEVINMAQELGSLGEMLQIEAFTSLCQSVVEQLEAKSDRTLEIAQQALQAWRTTQATILVGELHTLPKSLITDQYRQEDSQLLDLIMLADFELPVEKEELAPSVGLEEGAVSLSLSGLAATNDEPEAYLDSTVRVPTKLLERLNDWFGELTIARNSVNVYTERLRDLSSLLKLRVRAMQNLDSNLAISSANIFEPSDYFLPQTMLQDLVRLQEVTNDIDLTLAETDQSVGELNRVAKQLQTSLTQVRMRPFADLVARFPRFIRELASEYGKNVEFKVSGEQTLIDRTILEALNNPLMHLLRNAFDHGIEKPEIRSGLGKQAVGTIEIKAAYLGNQTIITVKDDGGGINLELLRAHAQQLGIEPPSEEEQLLSLIFEPGFSTASQVTALSGRGVGMDIVRTNLRQIRGDIKVDTQLGVGTTFTLSVPLTLSVAKVILVETNSILLAFPVESIREILLPNPNQFCEIAGKEAISWEGLIAPLIRLDQWLKPRQQFEQMAFYTEPTVLTVEDNNEWVGLLVNRSLGEQEVVIRQVEPGIAMPPGFSSCAILGDGRVAPLVNVPALLTWIAKSNRAIANLPPKVTDFELENKKDTILVVDDSINVRRFLSLTLEKAGYRVEQAQDGQEALEKLLTALPIKAVICDVDMPRLDGYGFLGRVKSNSKFKQLPIAMLTSRSGTKDRQLAMQLGATAYFSKPYNEHELLQAIKQMVDNTSKQKA
ncbi:hybrid sensor histidine kinase/response regulator [Synechocystis sp. PCC 7509]|uniref:hybrid sensor histidine kinase/response regulator n=1 Tax=Synechocystis sp. PCC 7509 TaxID=927677 RepID=UPI0002AD1060|nr:hybrid sensor histidine kinase/response regulator [Synechocystis sp. PCC 7509]